MLFENTVYKSLDVVSQWGSSVGTREVSGSKPELDKLAMCSFSALLSKSPKALLELCDQVSTPKKKVCKGTFDFEN